VESKQSSRRRYLLTGRTGVRTRTLLYGGGASLSTHGVPSSYGIPVRAERGPETEGAKGRVKVMKMYPLTCTWVALCLLLGSMWQMGGTPW